MTHFSRCLDMCLTSTQALKHQPFEQLAIVLGDQLNAAHSWYRQVNPKRLILMMEMRQETDYTTHHIQKVVGFFAAMRQFAEALSQAGHKVLYLTLDEPSNQQNLVANIDSILHSCPTLKEVCLQQPDEYRVDQQLQNWAQQSKATVTWSDTEHFLTQRDVLARWFPNQSRYIMENFYRRMRKESGYLMVDGRPIGNKWNFDKQNRNKIPAQHQVEPPLCFAHNVSEIVDLVQQEGVKTIGEIDANRFIWPINRSQSRQLLTYFVEHLLVHFGRYQDAMHSEHWSLYHARLSFSLNSKMLSPREVVEKVIDYWLTHQDTIDLAQVEGFVRQIIGWREFIRAMYWQHMPSYGELNQLHAKRMLPEFYWHGHTKMNCMKHSIEQSLQHAYAHHIQRLMITGNFALLIGANPDAVDSWYLGIYIDALEWVELPNTRGMSQFADGGLLATKPYASSGAYINKMSNYCGDCHYQVSARVGDKACPFNSLYWHFIDQHQESLSQNPRMRMIVRQWQQRATSDQQSLLEQAGKYLAQINDL